MGLDSYDMDFRDEQEEFGPELEDIRYCAYEAGYSAAQKALEIQKFEQEFNEWFDLNFPNN